MKNIFVLWIIFSLASCVKDDYSPGNVGSKDPNDNSIIYSGLVHIDSEVISEENQNIIVLPGTTMTFGPEGILVARGDFIAEGTPDEPIFFIGNADVLSHRIIKGDWGSHQFNFRHVNIKDGYITAVSDKSHLQYVTFVNTKKLTWSDAAARFWFRDVLIEDCEIFGNNTGNGFLVHDTEHPIVRNCKFHKTPDAVEYISCVGGIINNNRFYDMDDDGVDLNSCTGTSITNNEFYNVLDRGLELGSENYGSSHDISVDNNLFVDCNVAINVKESSDAMIKNATFYNNKLVLDVQTPADSSRISFASMTTSVLVENETALKIDDRSERTVDYCLSDTNLEEGSTTNKVGTITFENIAENNFNILSSVFPDGHDKTTIGYQR